MTNNNGNNNDDVYKITGYCVDEKTGFLDPIITRKEDSEKHDPVNRPKHYTTGKYETIEVIEDWNLNFHLGNVVKYVSRAGHKNNKLEDLKKARWYLNRYINQLENKDDNNHDKSDIGSISDRLQENS